MLDYWYKSRKGQYVTKLTDSNVKLKALHLGRAFKMHIETLRFLFDQIPELTCLQQQSRQV